MKHSNGRYYWRRKEGGKEKWTSLKTTSLAVAKRRLADAMGVERPKEREPRPRGPLNTGYVYLMQSGLHSYTKIGFSVAPIVRERTLQAEDPELVKIFECEAYQLFERWLHRRKAEKRIRGEWFALTAEEIQWVRSGAAMTEWAEETPVARKRAQVWVEKIRRENGQ